MEYYRHYKGRYYRLIGAARHSETLDEMVVYQALYGEQALWVRPKAMFYETVNLPDGREVLRFTPCSEEEALASTQDTRIDSDTHHALLLDDLYQIFKEKGYTAEDFQGGCSNYGEVNEFPLDLIDGHLRGMDPSSTVQERDSLVRQLYEELFRQFEKDES